MNEIIIFLQRILSATVADWDKDNFDEDKVNRASNGRFSNGSGSSATSRTPREIENSNIKYVSDLNKAIQQDYKVVKGQIMFLDPKSQGRDRYLSELAIVVGKDDTDKVLEKIKSYNNDDYAITAEVCKRNDGNNGLLISVFDKKQVAAYPNEVTEAIHNDWLAKRIQSGHETQKDMSETTSGQKACEREVQRENRLLQEMQTGTQTEHFVVSPNGGTRVAFKLDEYINSLKDMGVTDKELAMAYLFTVSPTSMRMGGSDPKSVVEPERKLCVDLANQLESFIEKAPKWDGGQLLRGCHVSQKIYDKIMNDEFVDMLGVSSWSSDEYEAQAFADATELDKPEIPIVFRLNKTNHGASVAAFSQYPHEQEVILSNKVKLKKVGVSKDDDGYTYIDLEEVGMK